ncbi:unnamed protein product [Ambrosiozyma monospora]|uniref:ATP-dependent RNA helicase DRS1 n=1 Tax=Ambrosiozyma monospora TaxID=43982 RepID=A0A9W6Z0M6_AMBMO|nr:unnamed protein product [Ambrosiozyma monospora]
MAVTSKKSKSKSKVTTTPKQTTKSKKINFDFVPTISDSEDDIPDLDEDSANESETETDPTKPQPTTPKKKSDKKKNSAKKSKSKTKTNNESDEEEEGSKDKDLNPDFIFNVGDDLGPDTNFDGWDFQSGGDAKSAAGTGADVKRDVDLEGIIRRKGGLTGQFANNGEDDGDDDEEEEGKDEDEDDEEEEEKEGGDDSDDEELAMDGFGMGAAAKPNKLSEDDDDDSDEDDEDEEDEDEEDVKEEAEEEEVEADSDQDNDKEMEDEKDEDSPEEVAKFFASEDDESTQAAKSQIHKDFQSMQLSRPVLKGLQALGYTKPSPIQSASIPIALLGKDIVAGAVTGSGKTAAYMIPIIERLLYRPAKIASTRVIVLAPTRELAIQVADVGRKIGQYVNGLTFGLAVGGLNLRQQEQELKKRPDIVIATPGRFIDHIRNSPSFNVDGVEVLVFDEADRMLEEGFQKEVTEILSLVPTKRQTMLFSATMNSRIKDMIQLSLNKPVRIMINPPNQTATGLMQEFVRIRKREQSKPALLFNMLSKLDSKQQIRIIVFVARKESAHRLRIVMGLLGLRVSELHGSLTQDQRLKSITDFKKLTVPILICTDLAARGLDIPKIEVVINYDMPKTHEIYLHRVGRTARAGREGTSMSFVGESSQDRAIVKEAIKQVELTKSGKAVGKNVDWPEIEKINKVIQEKQEIIEEILVEEKQEKEIIRAEMELKKSENLLNYKDEIKSRPKRTWFQSEKEKKADKLGTALAKGKKINSKKRKQQEAREDAGGSRSYKKTKTDRVEDQERTMKRQKPKNQEKNKKKKRNGKFGTKR